MNGLPLEDDGTLPDFSACRRGGTKPIVVVGGSRLTVYSSNSNHSLIDTAARLKLSAGWVIDRAESLAGASQQRQNLPDAEDIAVCSGTVEVNARGETEARRSVDGLGVRSWDVTEERPPVQTVLGWRSAW